MLLKIYMVKKLFKLFMKKNCKRLIKKKRNKLFVTGKGYDNSFNSWIGENDVI